MVLFTRNDFWFLWIHLLFNYKQKRENMKFSIVCLLVVSALFASCAHEVKKGSPNDSTGVDTSKFVVVMQKIDTAYVTFEYEGTAHNVLYEEGFILRKGLYSAGFKDKWKDYTDYLFSSNWQPFTGKVLRLTPRPKVDSTKK